MFPATTLVNKVVPKNAFYKHLEVSSSMKEHFVDDVERIVWANKIAPSTLNVAQGKSVLEITVFNVLLKTPQCPMDVFIFIDKNLPRHAVFILSYEDKVSVVINFKEAVQNSSSAPFKVTKTYSTSWMKNSDLEIPLQGSNMDSIYENMVRYVAGAQIQEETESLKDDISKSNEIALLKKEIESLKAKINAERQPQKKFVLHKKLKELENKIKI